MELPNTGRYSIYCIYYLREYITLISSYGFYFKHIIKKTKENTSKLCLNIRKLHWKQVLPKALRDYNFTGITYMKLPLRVFLKSKHSRIFLTSEILAFCPAFNNITKV